ncbi:helix-turn-helix domain-containing protein [Corynebacterium sp. H113]|uniref:helix-turn-helix domain-containing protein n=1 Tax=Corynebacterium sp. H113 TaxID=3133419 RepID=UPI0030AB32A4
MLTVARAVHPGLRRCLAAPMVAYDLLLPADVAHVGLPSTAATVVIAVDEAMDVGWFHEPETSTRLWCSISGLHLGPALIRTHGLQRGIHLSVTPFGCRALFGVPISAVAGCIVNMAELPGGISAVEHEAIVAKSTWDARLVAVEELLLSKLQTVRIAPDMNQAWALLTNGARVSQVAGDVGWSRRHLVNRVRAEFGVSPKQISRLARFERAHRLVTTGMQLAETAHEVGYADQAHLSREWRVFAGRSPKASSEEFPKLQDLLQSGS